MHFAMNLRRAENQELVSGGVRLLFVTVWDPFGNPPCVKRRMSEKIVEHCITSVVTTSNNKECPSDCKQVETHTL